MPIPNSTVDDERLLTEVQAADLLRLSPRTLQAWRCQGTGPAFVRAGRAIRYRRAALIAWAQEQTVTPKQARGARPASESSSEVHKSPSHVSGGDKFSVSRQAETRSVRAK